MGQNRPKSVPKTRTKESVAGWGDLNKALNGLVRAGTILGYTTAHPGNGGPVGVEVATAKGADQAEVVGAVRQALPPAFSAATVRTREG